MTPKPLRIAKEAGSHESKKRIEIGGSKLNNTMSIHFADATDSEEDREKTNCSAAINHQDSTDMMAAEELSQEDHYINTQPSQLRRTFNTATNSGELL